MNKNKRTLIPKLRFPEFRDNWQHSTIGELFNPDDHQIKATCFESDKILTVRLHTNGVVKNERTSLLTGGANYFTRRAGQFIFSKIDLLNGAFGIIPEEYDGYYSSSDVPAFTFETEHSPTFFIYWLTAKYRRLEIERTGTSATLKRVSPEMFWKLPILLPTLPEQQKIAACLSSLDELITAEGRMLEALRKHKKGLIQQLFPQPGESQPRLRFPEFRGKEEWGKYKLGELVDIYSGKSPSQYVLSSDGAYPFVKVEDLNNSTKYQVKSRQYCNDIEDAVPKGSVLFPKRGAAIELNKIRIASVEILMDTNLMAIAPFDSSISEFLFYYLCQVGLSQIADSSTIPQINNKHIIPFVVYVPLQTEQHRIAACLSALDDQITAQAKKIDALKEHKRGLMQQLFPSQEVS